MYVCIFKPRPNLICERWVLSPLRSRKPRNTYEIKFFAAPSNSFLFLKFSFRGSFTASNIIMSFPLETTEMTSNHHLWRQIPRFKPRPHLWEGSALSTALSLPCSPGNSEILTKSDFVLRCQNLSCYRNSPSVEAFLRLTKLCHYRRHLGHL